MSAGDGCPGVVADATAVGAAARGRGRSEVRRWTILALVAGLVAFGIGDKERGNRLYRAGRYADAAAAYAQALKDGDDSPELHYDYGTALLRLGRYDEADRHFRLALRQVEPELRERTMYNLGNRYLYAARAASAASAAAGGSAFGSAGAAPPPDTRPLLDSAVTAYQQALRIDPQDRAAKWNLELALKQQRQQGGGGQQQKQSSGGARQQPRPQQRPNANPPPQPQMSQAQAERILSAAENDERQLYKDKVHKSGREMPTARDW